MAPPYSNSMHPNPLTSETSTIFALSSAPGRAGVAVIRISGPAAQDVLKKMVAPLPKPRVAAFRTIRHPETGEALDRAVVLWFAAPLSETGEDVVEFQAHGSRAVVAALLSALATIPGCRLAEPGEFARRAFENGKLDLAEVEGLADLIDAETDAQRRQALAQAGGSLSRLYEGWRARLIEIAALTEAAIDFSDEGDVSASSFAEARKRAETLAKEIAAHLDDDHRGEILRDGFRVALLGSPNAGKSSLLNALARRDAAIVSSEAGTTRDVIEVRLDLGGLPVIVSDTAGIREASSEVEQEGIRRSLAVAHNADLILWLAEKAESIPPLGFSRETSLVIRSKADLPHESQPGPEFADLAISAKTGAGLDRLIAVISQRAQQAVGSQTDPAITQARHRQALEAALSDVNAFLSGPPDDIELRAEDVRRAAQALGRITGRVDVEDVLDQIFSRFCIGK
ncbi:MAG TPA: tRNA uridine-5-carboxymethylaminomethyl(34) synthesis GTPase MnmE [Hyphomicrobium sp.]|nr:tRNA uridine-5-carboxymethylaminomethyl(34) synthesis GTPase MnmE [Hyphomicrobium sp.]